MTCERCKQFKEDLRQSRYGVAALIVAAGGCIEVSDTVLHDVMGGGYEIIQHEDPLRKVVRFLVKPPIRASQEKTHVEDEA